MKDLFVGLSAAFTAAAGVITLIFERAFADTSGLQNKLVREGKSVPAAKTLAEQKRRTQKLRTLGAMVTLAFAFSVAALLVNNDESEPKPPTKCSQEAVAECFNAVTREIRREKEEIQRLAHNIDVLARTLKHAEVERGAR